MAAMEYLLVRGTLDLSDPYPMQGIELDQVASQLGLRRAKRLELHPDDYGWEVVDGQGLIQTEVVYHPGLLPERLVVRAPEGGDLKRTFETAKLLADQLGANAFNKTTGDEIAHHFPGATAAETARKSQEGGGADRKGCLLGLLGLLPLH